MEKIKDQIDSVIQRVQRYSDDLSGVEEKNAPNAWGSTYTKLLDYIETECKNLRGLIEKGDGYELLPTGVCRRQKFGLKLYERQALDLLYEVIRDDKHIVFSNCDIFDAKTIVQIMTVFEDEPGFYHRCFKDRVQTSRELGGMIARDGVFIKKKGSEYIPVDPDAPYDEKGNRRKKGNRVCNLWIIRNEAKYEQLGPADFYREFKKQRAAAIEMYKEEFDRLYPAESFYNNDQKRIVASPQLEEPISFI